MSFVGVKCIYKDVFSYNNLVIVNFHVFCFVLLLVQVLSCQPRVTVTSCFVYKVITDLASIDHWCINPIHRIGLIHKWSIDLRKLKWSVHVSILLSNCKQSITSLSHLVDTTVMLIKVNDDTPWKTYELVHDILVLIVSASNKGAIEPSRIIVPRHVIANNVVFLQVYQVYTQASLCSLF